LFLANRMIRSLIGNGELLVVDNSLIFFPNANLQ